MAINIDSWAKSVGGRLLDLDGAPVQAPYQCHDVWLSYLYALGGKPGDGHAPGTGFTDQVWRQFPDHRPNLATIFTKLKGKKIKRGDVVFWSAYAGVGGLPHVAVALADAKNGTVLCMTQNPRETHRETLTLEGVLGVLRPKALAPAKPAKPAPAKPKPKTTAQLATEVLAGKHGNGDARKKSLGSRYAAVQTEVEKRLASKAKPKPKPKSIDALAREVIAGKHGVGEARRKKLGKQYAAVQRRVNEILG